MLDTPVLFIVFNRPETTQRVFEAISRAKPRQLFVAADGPRADRPEEQARCEEVRRIATAVDWNCEVHTLYRNENLGCGKGPVEAISWFFENVEQGIILEDDCLPAQSFFLFCEILLNKYKEDYRIHSIAGTNILKNWSRGDASYFFSVYSGIWGWATWRRSWNSYDYYAKKWEKKEVQDLYRMRVPNEEEQKSYINALNKTVEQKNISWWDYQWIFSRIINSSFGIVPKVNLVSNIGFGPGATHTVNSESEFGYLPIEELEMPLIEPSSLMIDYEYDKIVSLKSYPNQKSLSKSKRFINKVKKLLFK